MPERNTSTRMPTVVFGSVTAPATASTDACSHKATRRGVASTGTSPDP